MQKRTMVSRVDHMKEWAFIVRDEELASKLQFWAKEGGPELLEEIEIVAVIENENEHSDDS